MYVCSSVVVAMVGNLSEQEPRGPGRRGTARERREPSGQRGVSRGPRRSSSSRSGSNSLLRPRVVRGPQGEDVGQEVHCRRAPESPPRATPPAGSSATPAHSAITAATSRGGTRPVTTRSRTAWTAWSRWSRCVAERPPASVAAVSVPMRPGCLRQCVESARHVVCGLGPARGLQDGQAGEREEVLGVQGPDGGQGWDPVAEVNVGGSRNPTGRRPGP